jgi:hypothetical protein
MPKFKVEITETLQKTVEVDAEDKHQAEEIAEEKYGQATEEEFILDAEAHMGTTFEVVT